MISYAKLSKLSLIYILMIALFSRFTEHYYLWKILLLVILGCLLSFDAFRKALTKILLNKYLAILCGLVLLNFIKFQDQGYFFGNLNLLFWPFLSVLIIVSLYLSDPISVSKTIDKAFIPLNFIMIFNLVVLIIQCSGIPVFIKSSWRAMNSYYEDLCCGLFGYNGTHELTMFLLFMNALNLHHYSKLKHNNKTIFLGYIFIVNIVVAITSTKNDNIAMFLFMPLFIIIDVIVAEYLKREKVTAVLHKFGKYIGIVVILVVCAFVLPSTRDFISEYVLIRVKMVFDVRNARYQINGSNERLAIPLMALCEEDGWILGKGIGTASYGGGTFFGFNHFGLSSIGSLIMTGGIWFYLSYTMFYSKTIAKMIGSKHKFPEITCFLSVIFLTAYTIFYTSFVTTIWCCLYFMILGITRQEFKMRFTK